MVLKFLIGLGLMIVSNVAIAAKNQDASVTFQLPVRAPQMVSTTALVSSDTGYVESKCIGGKLTLANLFTDARGKRVEAVVVYKIQFFNQGATTITATALFFTEDFTSPGDNVAWVLEDGPFNVGYMGRVDVTMAQVESGGDTYGENLETNMVLNRGSNAHAYLQIVNDGAAPISIGGDTRSASADFVARVFYYVMEK